MVKDEKDIVYHFLKARDIVEHEMVTINSNNKIALRTSYLKDIDIEYIRFYAGLKDPI